MEVVDVRPGSKVGRQKRELRLRLAERISLARLVPGPGGGRVQAVFMCACGSLDVAARGMCAPCLARQHRDKKCFGGLREKVLERDHHTCQGCAKRPGAPAGDYLLVHHREPGISTLDRMITLCPACHAIVHRLHVLRAWLPPRLVELWREQHPDAPEQLQLDVVMPNFNPDFFELDIA